MIFSFDFERALRDAGRLDELSIALAKASAEEENILKTLTQNWEGKQAEAYAAKGRALHTEMESSAKTLRTLAEEVRQIVEEVRRLELLNAQVAETR